MALEPMETDDPELERMRRQMLAQTRAEVAAEGVTGSLADVLVKERLTRRIWEMATGPDMQKSLDEHFKTLCLLPADHPDNTEDEDKIFVIENSNLEMMADYAIDPERKALAKLLLSEDLIEVRTRDDLERLRVLGFDRNDRVKATIVNELECDICGIFWPKPGEPVAFYDGNKLNIPEGAKVVLAGDVDGEVLLHKARVHGVFPDGVEEDAFELARHLTPWQLWIAPRLVHQYDDVPLKVLQSLLTTSDNPGQLLILLVGETLSPEWKHIIAREFGLWMAGSEGAEWPGRFIPPPNTRLTPEAVLYLAERYAFEVSYGLVRHPFTGQYSTIVAGERRFWALGEEPS